MPDLATPLPCRRPELVVRPLGEHGPYVVKDPGTALTYHLGDEEDLSYLAKPRRVRAVPSRQRVNYTSEITRACLASRQAGYVIMTGRFTPGDW